MRAIVVIGALSILVGCNESDPRLAAIPSAQTVATDDGGVNPPVVNEKEAMDKWDQ
jgi:hypothetical protein